MSHDKGLLSLLREHAYGVLSFEHSLTIMPTVHGARVPANWVKETDARIASVLTEETLREELARREKEAK